MFKNPDQTGLSNLSLVDYFEHSQTPVWSNNTLILNYFRLNVDFVQNSRDLKFNYSVTIIPLLTEPRI